MSTFTSLLSDGASIVARIKEDLAPGIDLTLVVESGSRSFGWPSKQLNPDGTSDSDQDIRGFYRRAPRQYNSQYGKRDKGVIRLVIEIEGKLDLDVELWDIEKAIDLFYNGNQIPLTWLTLPPEFIFFETEQSRLMLEFMLNHSRFDRQMSHDYGIARKGLAKFILSKKIKKLIYALRSILSALWCAQTKEHPPVNIFGLLELEYTNPLVTAEFRQYVRDTVAIKVDGKENVEVDSFYAIVHPSIPVMLENIMALINEHKMETPPFDTEWSDFRHDMLSDAGLGRRVTGHLSHETRLGNRMKMYERRSEVFVPVGSPCIARFDGHRFSKWTKKMGIPPGDPKLHEVMCLVAADMLTAFPQSALVYTQSDEITVTFPNGIRAYRGNVTHVATVMASFTSVRFTHHFEKVYTVPSAPDVAVTTTKFDVAYFDGRVFSVPTHRDVVHNVLFRAFDCRRNSIWAFARLHLPLRDMFKMTGSMLVQALAEQGICYTTSVPDWNQFGTTVKRELYKHSGVDPRTSTCKETVRGRPERRRFQYGKDHLQEDAVKDLCGKYWPSALVKTPVVANNIE